MKTALAYILGFTVTFTAISGGMYFLSKKYPWMFSPGQKSNNGGKLKSTVNIPFVDPSTANADTTGDRNETVETLKAMLATKNDSLAVQVDTIQSLDSQVVQLRQNKSDEDNMIAKLQSQVKLWGNQKRKDMAAAYQDMSPAAAAKIMANLDDKDIVFILSTVQKKQAARIMGALDPTRAAKLISSLDHSQ